MGDGILFPCVLFWERIFEQRGLLTILMTRGPYFDTGGLDFNSFLELRSGTAGPVGTLARFLEKGAVWNVFSSPRAAFRHPRSPF